MKKTLVLVAIVLSTVFASAGSAPKGYTKIPKNQLETYKAAIFEAMSKNPDSVNGCDSDWIYQTVNFLNEVWISSTSAQPLMIVNTFYSVDDDILHRLVIGTETDLKTINSVLAEAYEKGDVNTGDLAHPVIVHDYVLQSRTNCTNHFP